MSRFKFFMLPLFLVLISLSACKDDEMSEDVDPCTSDFDQELFFTNIARNVIVPNFKTFQSSMDELQSTYTDFFTDQNSNTLSAVREATKAAWINWQKVAQYSFGPAENIFLRNILNNFPLNVAELESKIENQDFDFSNPDTYDKGFPALDYLFFGIAENEAAILDFYQSNENASDYLIFTNGMLNEMKRLTDDVTTQWEGSYQNDFIKNTGTAAGTSLSQIINSLNQNYELIKREKIGVPSGVLTLGFPNPENVEALYSGISLELAEAAVQASLDYYEGRVADGTNGLGLDDYLVEVAAQKDGQNLNTVILEQFAAAQQAFDRIDAKLPIAVEEETEDVENLYKEITRNVVNLKTDMPSVLCISITYIDNPSDSD